MVGQTRTVLWVVVVIFAVLGVYMISLNQGGNTGEEAVKIGFIGPLSGDAAAYGQEAQKVLSYRLAEINKEKGTKFEIIWEDGKCSGSDAVSAFQKLTDIDGVKIVIGGICSSETLGIAPLTKDGKALLVSFASSNPTIEGASPYTFTLSYSDQVVGETLAQEMSNFSKVAIITEQNDYNIGIRDVWEKEIAGYNDVAIVANEIFPKGGSDFRNLLAKIRRANPEAVLLNPNIGVTAENLLKQLAEIKDWNGYKIYSPIAYLSDDARASVGDFANGMILIDAPDLTDPEFLSYKTAIEETAGKIPTLGNYYTASAIDDLNILTSLIRELGNDQKAVRDALAQKTFNGYLGDIYFGGQSFKQGSRGGVYAVENGKAVYQR
jgi:branched-chain amino acid transport system substrate-binding protein